MDIEQIKQRVAAIESCKADDEAAHSMEDDLRDQFIGYIATLSGHPLQELAIEILKTNEIEFARWCA